MKCLSPALLLSLTLAAPALAVDMPSHLAGRPELESFDGSQLRQSRRISRRSPAAADPAWRHFLNSHGNDWRATWDHDTLIPQRIYGAGIPAPGSQASAALAEAAAWQLFGHHLDLFAPGSQLSDFQIVSNHLGADGVRTVAMVQHHNGLEVLGGQISLRFVQNRIVTLASEAWPRVSVDMSGPAIPDHSAASIATKWIADDFQGTAEAKSVEAAAVFAAVKNRADRGIEYKHVIPVRVVLTKPIGEWTVFVDAQSGTPVARRQELRFMSGTVLYNSPLRWPGADRQDYPAREAEFDFGGSKLVTDENGIGQWEGNSVAAIVASAVGPFVRVVNSAGEDASETLQLSDGGQAVWNAADDEFVDAQLVVFIHTAIAKEFARTLNPELAWLDEQIRATVNIDDACNAFSTGDSINFYRSSGQCGNTGRLADVVYHEFGHSLHAQSIIRGAGAFDGAFSEGLSDYLAATIQNDPAMGRGFFRNAAPLRHIDPEGEEKVYPDDVVDQVHQDGLIFAGAMWDLRKLLVEQHGEEAGVAIADRLFYAAVQRASDIPTTYIEILTADDDDGNLDNATPNACAINAAFALHGLAERDAPGLALLGQPARNELAVTLPILEPSVQCPIPQPVSASLFWGARGVADTAEISMDIVDGEFAGQIPEQGPGRSVRYRVEVTFDDGSVRTYPENKGDPNFQFFVGEVEELYCNNFDGENPYSNGWEHGLSAGMPGEGADDWIWGPPGAPASSGDPSAAYSGDFLIGNDIGGNNRNGLYQGDKTNWTSSPVVDVGDRSNVRLQYRRWLTVEDANFDKATIYANDQQVWQNLNSNLGALSDFHHTDREWRFHDVEITDQVVDGKVQIRYELASDSGNEFGGWNIDDFCIVAFAGEAVCGNGVKEAGEDCDDGNTAEDDSCPNSCQKSGGCSAGGQAPGAFALGLLCLALVLRRRHLFRR